MAKVEIKKCTARRKSGFNHFFLFLLILGKDSKKTATQTQGQTIQNDGM
ncbi:MAG: hypothetical protein P8P30_10365 [Rickettsiales bacterium]|nr:hypothetical protein [Rickettsiales bacterium]